MRAPGLARSPSPPPLTMTTTLKATHKPTSSRPAGCFAAALGLLGVFSLTESALAHEATSWSHRPTAHRQSSYPVQGYHSLPSSQSREAVHSSYSHSSEPAYGMTPVEPLDPWQQVQQQAEKCQRGRLLGGIVGGGVGYVASRSDGRSWAVPLGALLGSQMGCSTAAGRGPVPW